MNPKERSFKGTITVACLAAAALAVLIFFGGCADEQPASQGDHTGHEHTSTSQPAAQQQSADQAMGGTVAVEQTTCPVMEDNPINKKLFVEYKGKKVYFCCAGCPDVFKANPEKYVSKLPQFQN